jgi:hypothetical protein
MSELTAKDVRTLPEPAADIEQARTLPEYLDTAQLAALVQRPASTLRYWRSRGVGPPWIKPPGVRGVLYRRSGVEAWLNAGQHATQVVTR